MHLIQPFGRSFSSDELGIPPWVPKPVGPRDSQSGELPIHVANRLNLTACTSSDAAGDIEDSDTPVWEHITANDGYDDRPLIGSKIDEVYIPWQLPPYKWRISSKFWIWDGARSWRGVICGFWGFDSANVYARVHMAEDIHHFGDKLVLMASRAGRFLDLQPSENRSTVEWNSTLLIPVGWFDFGSALDGAQLEAILSAAPPDVLRRERYAFITRRSTLR